MSWMAGLSVTPVRITSSASLRASSSFGSSATVPSRTVLRVPSLLKVTYRTWPWMWTCPTGRLGCGVFVLAANRSFPTKKTRCNGCWEVSLSAAMCRRVVANMVVPLSQLDGRMVLGGGPGVYSKHHGIRSSRWTARHRFARKIRYSYLISAHSSAHNGKPHWKVNMHGRPVPTWFEWYDRVDSNHRPFAPEAKSRCQRANSLTSRDLGRRVWRGTLERSGSLSALLSAHSSAHGSLSALSLPSL